MMAQNIAKISPGWPPSSRTQWFMALASAVRADDPNSMAADMPLFADLPDAAFTGDSLRHVAASIQRRGTPSYGEIRGPLDAWWAEHRPRIPMSEDFSRMSPWLREIADPNYRRPLPATEGTQGGDVARIASDTAKRLRGLQPRHEPEARHFTSREGLAQAPARTPEQQLAMAGETPELAREALRRARERHARKPERQEA